MPRSKNKVASRAKRKKVLDMAKGNFGRRKNVYTVAKNTVEKGLQHAYVGRKLKKREFRGLWIQRINAAARLNGVSYSVLMSQLKKANIELDRKALAEIAYTDAAAFTAIVNKVDPLALTIETGLFTAEQKPYLKGITKPGIGPDIKLDDRVVVADIKGVRVPEPKSLDEARGLITAAYQDDLEKNWIKELRAKYTVSVDQDVLHSIK